MLLRLFVLALFAFSGLPGLAQEEDTSSPKLRVEWAEFKKLYDAKKIEVIDVRPTSVFESGHIPRSLSVPLEEIERRTGEIERLNKPIVLYCA
jgi:rhodanese-related sulfurtransferase